MFGVAILFLGGLGYFIYTEDLKMRESERRQKEAQQRFKAEQEAEKLEMVAMAAANKAVTLDELAKVYPGDLTVREDIKVTEWFDKYGVILFKLHFFNNEDKEWFIHLDDEGYAFCKQWRARPLVEIMEYWRARKK